MSDDIKFAYISS